MNVVFKLPRNLVGVLVLMSAEDLKAFRRSFPDSEAEVLSSDDLAKLEPVSPVADVSAAPLEGWTLGENEQAAWAQSPRVDMTIDAADMLVEVDTRDAGTVTATIPLAVLREVLRRVDAKGKL